MYGECVATTAKALVKSPWTFALPLGLSVAFVFAAMLLGGLGPVGGFLLGLALAAGTSAYLYFVGEVVAQSKTSLTELKKSFTVYFWSVISVQFVFWVVGLVLDLVLGGNPQKAQLLGAFWLVSFVALNAVPETIYVKGTRSGIDTIVTSFKFLQEHWVEWFLANGLLVAAWYFRAQVLSPLAMIGAIPMALVLAALGHAFMVFRGVLYVALDGTTHRQRMFKYRS